MARTRTTASKNLKQTRWAKMKLPAIVGFVLAFGGLGVYLLSSSSAAPMKSVKPVFAVITDYSTAQQISPKLYTVQDSVYYTAAPQTVIQLPVGVSASFGPTKGGGTMYPTQTCYYMRAVGTPSTATITSGSNQQVVTVANDLNWYQKVCLPYSASGSLPNFSVRNEAGGLLNVYQQVLEFTQT